MKTSYPKMILNLSFENEELEEKVKLAMDEYAEKIVLKNLDTYIAKVVERRLEYLIKGYTKIDGKTLNTFINEKCSETIEDVISKNIKEIFAKKVAELL